MYSNIWKYKNFNMVFELDVSGEFIYNGIQELNRMSIFNKDAPAFFSLYNISVGIERLQKIILVLWKLDVDSDIEEFEKSLITHSHCALNDEIKKCTKREILNRRENDFISLINIFYKSARYNRFNINSEYDYEVNIFRQYLEKYMTIESNAFDLNGVLMSDEVKEFLGRVIGSISQKYYALVKEGSSRNNTYTYELRSFSKAEKVFLSKYRKQSLMEGQLNERIAFKELLLFIRNSKEDSAFFKYMSEIPPLEFDKALIGEYINELSNNIVPQDLIDEVETLYSENGYSYERVQSVDLMGTSYVQFDYPDILECNFILEKILNDKSIDKHIIDSLTHHAKYIEEDDILDILDNVRKSYEQYKDGITTLDYILNEIKKSYDKYQEFIHKEFIEE